MHEKTRKIEAELRETLRDFRAKVRPLAAQTAEKLLADTTESLRPAYGDRAKEMACQSPVVRYAFERVFLGADYTPTELVVELKRLMAIQAELEREAAGEPIALKPDRSTKVDYDKVLREAKANVQAFEKAYAPLRLNAKAKEEAHDRTVEKLRRDVSDATREPVRI
jgi:hypothetical protein